MKEEMKRDWKITKHPKLFEFYSKIYMDSPVIGTKEDRERIYFRRIRFVYGKKKLSLFQFRILFDLMEDFY